jgi:hypothetical protein
MVWGIAGGLLGIVIMVVAYRWVIGWVSARAGHYTAEMIGSRPRSLAGIPEEAPFSARTPPAMEVMRYGAAAAEHAAAVEAANAAAAQAQEEHVEIQKVPPVSAGIAAGVEVARINHSSEDSGEYVVIANSGASPVALVGWKLTDKEAKNSYEFPDIVVAAGESIMVHMWRGEDTATELFVGRRSNWWNNAGDTAYLYDKDGTLVHQLELPSSE